MIGRMIDINYHLIIETGHPPPPDYHASFSRLGDLKILEPELARRIARCAGLRNRLVHEYDEIDPQKVFGISGRSRAISAAARHPDSPQRGAGGEALWRVSDDSADQGRAVQGCAGGIRGPA